MSHITMAPILEGKVANLDGMVAIVTRASRFFSGRWWPTKHLETQENDLAIDVERNPISCIITYLMGNKPIVCCIRLLCIP